MILPAGTYNVEIQPPETEILRVSKNGDFSLWITMYVIDGEYYGKTICEALPMTDKLLIEKFVLAISDAWPPMYNLSSLDIETLMSFKRVVVDLSVERDFDRFGNPYSESNHIQDFRRLV